MNDRDWRAYRLNGQVLEVLEEAGCWRLRRAGREVSAKHLDHAVARLLNVPSHVAVKLALAILNAAPGDDVTL